MLVLGDEHDAEDIAQDAYLRAYRSWARFDGVDVRGWLYTIALRLAFNHLRGRRRWLAAIGRVEVRPWSDPTDPDLWAALRASSRGPDRAAAQRARRLHPGGDRRDARRAGGDGRELAVARAIGAAEGARRRTARAVVVCRQAPSGGTERLPGGAHGAPKPPDRGDRRQH